MTREAKLRRAKLVTLLNLLSLALVFSYVWGLLGPGLGVAFLIGLAICAAGLFHRWGIARSGLGFGSLAALLLCLYYYFFSDPNPATNNHYYGTLVMGYLLAGLSMLSLYYLKPEWFEFAQPWNDLNERRSERVRPPARGSRNMTREAKLRRAKLVSLLNLLSGALVLSYVWGLLGPGLGVTFLIGLAICAAGLFHRWGIARSGLGFGTLGALLLCLYYYLFSDPDPAAIDHYYGTLVMGHLLAGLSVLSLYYLKPEWFEFAQPWSDEEE